MGLYLNGYQGQFNPSQAVVIAISQQSSAAIDCNGLALCGIKLPATMTGTTLTFEMCDTLAGTYVPVTGQDGNALSYAIAASKYLAIDPTLFQGIRFLKIKSGSTELAARTLVCSLKGF